MASIARNTFYLTVAKALNTAIYAVFGLFLPRFVPAEQVGVYGLMTTLIFFGSFAASFGIPLVLVRALAKDKAEIRALFVDARASMMAAALLAGLAILGYMLLEMSFQEQMDVRRALLAFLVGGILLGDAIGAVGESIYQAHEEMELPALVEAGAGAFRAAFSVLALMFLPEPSRLFGVFGIFLIGSAGRGFLLAKLAQRRFLPGPLPPPSSRRSFRLLRESLSVALFRMLRMLRNRIDMILLGLLLPAGAVGLMEVADVGRAFYGQAMRVAVVFHTLTQGFNAAIFPRMARLTGKHGDLSEARRSFFRAVRYQAWWAAPLAAGIFLYSDNIAGWFGAQYRDGIPDLDVGGTTASALRILVIAMLLDAVGGPVGMMVLGTGTLDRFLPVLGGTLAATSVIFNLLWIPRYGILGAAQASLVASGIEIVIKVILVSKLFGNPWPLLLRPLPYFALAVGMGFALAAGPLASSPLLGGLAGAFSYGVVTLALGLVDPAIRKRLARLVRR